ncbi:MAG: PPC domain-containing protein [Planctomycetes bacterium]|nr:PPC domain-containing protein [Planctomycetota bacterium]
MPATGTYRVRVSDRGYRSAADSFYRLELLAGPQIVAIWPDLVGIDPPEEFSLYGFGLEGNVASPLRLSGIRSAVTTIKGGINLERDSINRSWRDHFESFATAIPRTKKQTSVAGQPRIRFAERAMAYENETATESAQNAQQLVVPALLNGRFDRRNDVDWFAFDAKKDESFRIDVYGERFGQAMDLDVAIQDSAGKSLITFPDSTAPKNLPAELARASLDVSATWKAPADGRFHLIVRDLYGSTLFGADRTYALSLRKAEPSFDVSVMPPNAKTPAGYSIPRGGRAAVRVALVRHDGFNEGVRMVLTEASRKEGLALDETWIGPGETSALAIVSRTANEANARLTHFLELEAATDSDKPLVRKASATTLLRAGATDRRFMDRLPIGVSAPPAATFVLSAEKSDITAGGSLVLTVVPEFHGVSLKAAAKIEFPSLPTGMKASTISLMPGKGEAKVTIPVPAKLPLGRYSIAAQVAATVVQETDSAKENTIAAWSNGITFQVVPKQPPK